MLNRSVIFGPLLLFLAQAADCDLLTREEALRTAFPRAEIKTSMIFLTDAQMQEARKISGVEVESALVARYEAFEQSKIVGRAYLDTHTVRTKKESLLLILDIAGNVKRVEVIAFLEPPEYMPSERWYEQFEGKRLTPDLVMRKNIHPVTGATLTAQSTTDAVRRMLAIDQILAKKDMEKH
jgi:hypothetical protein